MEKKYELIKSDKPRFYRPRALRDFGDVKRGSVGGYIQDENNLSQYGTAWVYGEALVYGEACVYDDAKIFGQAQVYDYAQVYDNSRVWGNALVSSTARVCGDAHIWGKAHVYGSAHISGCAGVSDNAKVCNHARVCGEAQLFGNVLIQGNAVIKSTEDYIVFKNWWSSGRYFTWTRSNNMWSVGCFYGSGKELIEKAYLDSEKSGREYEKVVNYVESILKEP